MLEVCFHIHSKCLNILIEYCNYSKIESSPFNCLVMSLEGVG